MTKALSRRSIAFYAADELLRGADAGDDGASGNLDAGMQPMADTASANSRANLLRHLAAYFIDTKRERELPALVRDIQFRLAEKGYVTGTMTTAHELSAATKAAVVTYAGQRTGARQVQLDTVCDPRVLGGLKLDLPGRELNTTIARQLTRLATEHRKV